jgi:uncharacterized membrane protein YfcA
MSEPWRTILTLAIGVLTGMLSALFGVGGAVVSTPAIRLLGATAFEAVGTTLPAIFPSAASGTARYRAAGLIRNQVVLWTGGVGAAAAVGGSLLSHAVPGNGHLLMIATAVLMGITGWRLARNSVAAEPVDPDATTGAVRAKVALQTWQLATVGVFAGALSGLLGIGGGIVMVPAFTEWLGLSIKESVGTSLACVAIIGAPGIVTHSILGDINWAYAIPLSIAVIPGARIGSKLAMSATDRTLRKAVGIGLLVAAIFYAAGEIIAL